MKNKILGSFYGFVVGDALGVPVEFKKREYLKRYPVTDMKESKTRRTTIGYWSDDTAMTLCTIQAILESDKVDTNTHKLMLDNYIKWMNEGYLSANKECFGIGQTVFKSLMNYRRSKSINEYYTKYCIESPKNGGNGALMRILPLVLYFYYNKLDKYKEHDYKVQVARTLDFIEFNIRITHNYIVNVEACIFYTLFINKLLDCNDLKESYKYAQDRSIERFSGCNSKEMDRLLFNNIFEYEENDIKSTGYVIDTLEASLWSLFNSNSYKDAVLKAVNLGGDTDTIAAITGSMAGIFYGYESIPSEWIENLLNKELLKEKFDCFLKILKEV